jgi:superfamily II DNA helicase RecQ
MPTLSLIFDQVTMLRTLGVEVDSTLESSLEQISFKVRNGLISMLYTTPGTFFILLFFLKRKNQRQRWVF